MGSITSGSGQAIQANSTADDTDDDVELFESYGFTSVPPGGSEGLVLRVGGERANSIAICFGDRNSRFSDLAAGEVAVYNSAGCSVVLRADGNIEVTPGDGGVVQLGGPTATLAVARETDPVVIPSLLVLQTAINSWVPVAGDGGAALKTALAAWLVGEVNDGTIEAGGEGATST